MRIWARGQSAQFIASSAVFGAKLVSSSAANLASVAFASGKDETIRTTLRSSMTGIEFSEQVIAWAIVVASPSSKPPVKSVEVGSRRILRAAQFIF
jgi:hypothetical protein